VGSEPAKLAVLNDWLGGTTNSEQPARRLMRGQLMDFEAGAARIGLSLSRRRGSNRVCQLTYMNGTWRIGQIKITLPYPANQTVARTLRDFVFQTNHSLSCWLFTESVDA